MLGSRSFTCLLLVAETLLIFLSVLLDVRSRRYPNALFLTMVFVGALLCVSTFGISVLLEHLATALLAAAAMTACEVALRRGRGGDAVVGMGDIKFVFALMLVVPSLALLSFAIGAFALFAAGRMASVSRLPMVPFIAGALAVILVIASVSAQGFILLM